MWRRAINSIKLGTKESIFRPYSVLAPDRILVDEGDWSYASEWWDQTTSTGQVVYTASSFHGNGIVTVNSYPSSLPRVENWLETERWLASRHKGGERFRVLGYQWRTLRFNDETRQSTAKVMVACMASQPRSLYLMQSPHCLAVPYLKSMVSLGLATIASCKDNLLHSARRMKTMRILCIGHGGGSLPLFLASKIPGAIIDIVDIDPVVITASIHAMGFPSYSVLHPDLRASVAPDFVSDLFWRGIQERLYLYESDAEWFILNTTSQYDIVFIDAYDGEDIFPRKLWDPDAPFLKTLREKLHPAHGTVVVNLHSDDHDQDHGHVDPIGSYINTISRAYKDSIVSESRQNSGAAYIVSAPWICNTALTVCRGTLHCDENSILHTIASKAIEVERTLNFPFSCLQFITNGFRLIS